MTQINAPYVLDETKDFAVVFKPPKIHCADKNSNFYNEPMQKKEDESETIFNWYQKHIKDNEYLQLLHRLDYETHGLVLFAKNEKSFDYLKDLQDKGEFIKEYSAVCSHSVNESLSQDSSFPVSHFILQTVPQIIESYFRPFGKGRKAVRPVIEDKKKHKETAKGRNGFYRTEIISVKENVFTVRINRGFRHQIRCHLCWIGYPILNDPLYPEEKETTSLLALRSHALLFSDPSSGKYLEYRIESLS
ncbi:MAG: pseudouridine synthase [Treponema sp.]|nr:pseudouridine synthase [Treponema sp.]